MRESGLRRQNTQIPSFASWNINSRYKGTKRFQLVVPQTVLLEYMHSNSAYHIRLKVVCHCRIIRVYSYKERTRDLWAGADLGRGTGGHVSLLKFHFTFFHHSKFYKIIEVPSQNLKIYRYFLKICLVPPYSLNPRSAPGRASRILNLHIIWLKRDEPVCLNLIEPKFICELDLYNFMCRVDSFS